uniref:Structural maintenance of chromosomes protein n=1 Tax=Neobodo designis TaxID=312471 RepID=A0A7S1R1H3_NEODS|mmetsp:Transcript_6243/g.19690  ORF Transcript_6243/g.19690 Transcript_6243/m.19690 type:complete len:1281 (+) Transcript_6243:254-4096(+)|eukprot:CAMPEP_0174838058 /NCGR_PEP_ID=MMETSP1114-20130205/7162_1 /TAXON_ID=312471 /ORGANISM="Neobodo designis, Strain CCAP 1951/1" /LENGTH=1280 /DNA_ID=CAMNT_0016072147 /DNA_START=241 /DNA_END=4083 /DNA_ORIENTATION=-
MSAAKVHRLELYNFKSYQGKVSIGPFKDFTCIVGPNGSGKSNVMDALSFVLGSAATTLRGERAADLINKKAKKKECHVTLVMKAASGEEKSLTRGINAKGAVELSVDGTACSEKEFAGVLKKFKVGSRLGTFLVFQHEVDAVAQKKAKDITELIENVSGSAELKSEYDRAKRELEAANKALTDATVDKRTAQAEVQQLKLHKQEAERYSTLQSRLAQERRDLALGELFYVEAQLAAQKEQLGAQAAEVDRLKAAVTSDADHAAAKKEYAEKHKQYLEELKKLRGVNSKLRENRATLERIKASSAHFTAKLARHQSALGSAKDTDATRNREVARLTEQLKQQERLLETLEDKWRSEDAADDKSMKKLSPADLEEYKGLRRDADCATITARQGLETLRRQRDAIKQSQRDTQMQIDRLQAAIDDDNATLENNAERAKALTARMDDTKAQHADCVARLDDLRATLHQASLRNKDHEEELAAVDAQLRELRFVKEDTRHSTRVAEALEALKAMHKGVRGRLVDLCTVKDNKYRNAVTVAFGKNLEAIVVDTVDTAMACVRYLKEQRVASLTFIPLVGSHGSAVDDSLRTLGGTCKPVIDLLKYDASIEPALRYAMGRTLVCDTMAEARRVAYETGERKKVVTVDGNMLQKNGSVQGGLAAVQARARKWDERQYDDLKKRRETLAREGGAASEAQLLQQRQQAAEAEAKAKHLESRLARDKQELADVEQRNAKILRGKGDIERNIKDLTKAVKAAEAKIDAIEKDMAKRSAEIAKDEGKIFAAFQKRVGIPNISEIEHHQQQQARGRAERRQQLSVAIHKLKTAIDAERRGTADGRNSEQLNKQIAQTEKELATCQKDQRQCQSMVDRDTTEQQAAQGRVDALKRALDALEERIRARAKNSEAEVRQLATARKHATMLQAACEALRHQRLALFQRCRMDDIDLPTMDPKDAKRARDADAPAESSSDSDDDGAARATKGKRGGRKSDTTQLLRTSEAFTSFNDSTGGRGSTGPSTSAGGRKSAGTGTEISVVIDFSSLPKAVRTAARSSAAFNAFRAQCEGAIEDLEKELDAVAPNLKATSHMQSSEQRLGQSATSLDQWRDKAHRALRDFTKVKELRTARFMQTFQRIVEHVDRIYRELTLGTRAQDVHGSAYLTLESSEEPYLGGTRYHATPPMKRYMAMEQLSGGERTMAAMALLFAIHATSPTPFFVLDEVDAALDIGNVVKLAHYLKTHAASGECQYIVVSLKEQLYHAADGLVGIYKDTARESSGVLTMDLTKAGPVEIA